MTYRPDKRSKTYEGPRPVDGKRKNTRPEIPPHRMRGVEGLKSTAKALLVRTQEGKALWVPQSVIHDDSEVWKEGDGGDLVVQGWFAEKNEWT